MKIIIILVVVAALMVCAHLWQCIHADKSLKSQNATLGDTMEEPPISATPKQYGIYLLRSGIWRRNRLKTKIKSV